MKQSSRCFKWTNKIHNFLPLPRIYLHWISLEGDTQTDDSASRKGNWEGGEQGKEEEFHPTTQEFRFLTCLCIANFKN